MSCGLVMMVKDEVETVGPTLDSVRGLIDTWTVVDTGSTDGTQQFIRKKLDGVPGKLFEVPWDGYGPTRNVALALAKDTADWLFQLDADFVVEHHPGHKQWLDGDPDPETDIWMVELVQGFIWRLPLIVRGGMDWEYVGPCHEYLNPTGRGSRPLLGVTIRPSRPGGSDPVRFVEYIRLLADGVKRGEPRAVFYTAESYRFLGDKDQAIALYKRRARMGEPEEEAWYAAYQAATLKADVKELLAVWRRRPHRHEPLTAAARLVAAGGTGADVLFLEAGP